MPGHDLVANLDDVYATPSGKRLKDIFTQPSDGAAFKEGARRAWNDFRKRVQDARAVASATVVEKDPLINAVFIVSIAHEHALLFGPPGSAKSMVVNVSIDQMTGGLSGEAEKKREHVFVRLLSRSTLPDELLGSPKIAALLQGAFQRNIERSIVRARIAFLDEILEADSMILNIILSVCNERAYWDGYEVLECLLISMFGATTFQRLIPDPLRAFYDRFLLRCRADYFAVPTAGAGTPPAPPVVDLPCDPDHARRLRELLFYYARYELANMEQRVIRIEEVPVGEKPGGKKAEGEKKAGDTTILKTRMFDWAQRVAGLYEGTSYGKPGLSKDVEPLDEFRFLYCSLWSPPFLRALIVPGKPERTTPFMEKYLKLMAFLHAESPGRVSDRRACWIFKGLLAACLFHQFDPAPAAREGNKKAINLAFRSIVPHLWDNPGDDRFRDQLGLVARALAEEE